MTTDVSSTQDYINTNVPESTPVSSAKSSTAANPAKAAPSTARRPTTRSQTGTVTKCRARDDAHVPETRNRALPARKRQKVTAKNTAALDSGSSHTQESANSIPPSTREASLCSTSSTPAVPSTQQAQLTFYHSSMSESDQPQSRLPRSRASLPTPIPNLTKKSRGRRVPTKDSNTDPDQKDNRLYVCTVEGCGKCFHRGEHLKRHIRSIHTHEKPFKCTFPLCEKHFNRHDNLLQHLKVHRQESTLPVPKQSSEQDENFATSLSAPPRQSNARVQSSYSAAEDEEEDEEPNSPVSPPARPRTIYDAFPPRYGPYSGTVSAPALPMYGQPTQNNLTGSGDKFGIPFNDIAMHGDMSSTEAMNILTNVAVSSLRMEVSSLRTELPQSPVEMRSMIGAPMAPC